MEVIRTSWQVDPAIAAHLPQRFKHFVVEREVGRWIRAHSRQVIDCPEALRFVVGDKTDRNYPRDLKVRIKHIFHMYVSTGLNSALLKFVLLWKPIAPVTAVTFFESRYASDPVLLQYAHRVLEEHPVNVTFFFVPQIVQSLRNDKLGVFSRIYGLHSELTLSAGYVKRFIFETSKISQLFCHQIIWNMKANCYKDDSATIVSVTTAAYFERFTQVCDRKTQ
jgi:phosphatidylinositol 4-kinase